MRQRADTVRTPSTTDCQAEGSYLLGVHCTALQRAMPTSSAHTQEDGNRKNSGLTLRSSHKWCSAVLGDRKAALRIVTEPSRAPEALNLGCPERRGRRSRPD